MHKISGPQLFHYQELFSFKWIFLQTLGFWKKSFSSNWHQTCFLSFIFHFKNIFDWIIRYFTLQNFKKFVYSSWASLTPILILWTVKRLWITRLKPPSKMISDSLFFISKHTGNKNKKILTGVHHWKIKSNYA